MWSEGRHRLVDDLVNVERLQLDHERSGLDPAHIKKIRDEPRQAVRLFVDEAEELSLLLLSDGRVGVEQGGGRCLDRGERRTEVVGDGAEESTP